MLKDGSGEKKRKLDDRNIRISEFCLKVRVGVDCKAQLVILMC